MTDARIPAFVAAWDCLEQIPDLEKLYRKSPQETRRLQELLCRTAEIYTALANSPTEVGEIAAALINSRREDERKNKNVLKDRFNKS